jgi:hypothetical protein
VVVDQEPDIDAFPSAQMLALRACCRIHSSVGW